MLDHNQTCVAIYNDNSNNRRPFGSVRAAAARRVDPYAERGRDDVINRPYRAGFVSWLMPAPPITATKRTFPTCTSSLSTIIVDHLQSDLRERHRFREPKDGQRRTIVCRANRVYARTKIRAVHGAFRKLRIPEYALQTS